MNPENPDLDNYHLILTIFVDILLARFPNLAEHPISDNLPPKYVRTPKKINLHFKIKYVIINNVKINMYNLREVLLCSRTCYVVSPNVSVFFTRAFLTAHATLKIA